MVEEKGPTLTEWRPPYIGLTLEVVDSRRPEVGSEQVEIEFAFWWMIETKTSVR